MRRLLPVLVLLSGCDRTCGDASFATAGEALEMWDADGDGRTANLIEECGPISGSFGLRREDLGLTTLFFDPTVPSRDFAESLRLSDILLPISNVTFYTHHLEEGATIGMDRLVGSGISKLEGSSQSSFAVYPLLEGQVTVLSGPRVPGGIVNEINGTERWRLQWDVTFGDPATGSALQVWSAEDVIDVTDGVQSGDVTYPPDWDPSRNAL